MDKILSDLLSTPGVFGTAIVHQNDGIVHNKQDLFPEQTLKKTTRLFSRMLASGTTCFVDMDEIALTFASKTFLLKPINEAVFVLLICQATEDTCSLASMALDMAKKDLKKHFQAEEHAAYEASEIVQTTYEELLKTGPIAESLKEMEASLCKVMGPMSKIVFSDALKNWIQHESPGFSTFPSLINIICEDIVEKDKVLLFKEEMTPYYTMAQR